MPEGHRAAARSVLDGREHDGIIDRRADTDLPPPDIDGPQTISPPDAGRKPRVEDETKFRHLCAGLRRR